VAKVSPGRARAIIDTAESAARSEKICWARDIWHHCRIGEAV